MVFGYPLGVDTPSVDELRKNPPMIQQVVAELDLSLRSLAAFLQCETKVIRAWQTGEHTPDGLRILAICALHRARSRRRDGRVFKDWFNSWLSTHKKHSLERLLEDAIVSALGDEQAAEVRAASNLPVAQRSGAAAVAAALLAGAGGILGLFLGGVVPPPELLSAVAKQYVEQMPEETKAQVIQALADKLER